jgi:hypothetical protein
MKPIVTQNDRISILPEEELNKQQAIQARKQTNKQTNTRVICQITNLA